MTRISVPLFFHLSCNAIVLWTFYMSLLVMLTIYVAIVVKWKVSSHYKRLLTKRRSSDFCPFAVFVWAN